MQNHRWPLKNKLPDPHIPIARADLEEFLDAARVQPDDAIWTDNYWQPVRQITQRPVDLIYISEDGVHLG